MVANQKPKKKNKLIKILLAITELYIENGTPIGSTTLQTAQFDKLSSATIRNYFSQLEQEGFLKKNHASGGRVPTDKAFRFYADYSLQENKHENSFSELKNIDNISLSSENNKHIIRYLQQTAELLSTYLELPLFLSSPRFDHDFLVDIKLLPLDNERLLTVLLTDFGQVFTEILWINQKLSSFSIKRIEEFLKTKIQTKESKELSREEEIIAQKIYNEAILRYLIRYTNSGLEDLFKTGFSYLLKYPELNSDPETLTIGLSLFENSHQMHLLLSKGVYANKINYFIGDKLSQILKYPFPGWSVITVPYYINHIPLGAIGLLGPTRIPYKKIFDYLKKFSKIVTTNLTESFYKFKLSFRQSYFSQEANSNNKVGALIDYSSIKLLPAKEL